MTSKPDNRSHIITHQATLPTIDRLLLKNEQLAQQFPDDLFVAATINHLTYRKNQFNKHQQQG